MNSPRCRTLALLICLACAQASVAFGQIAGFPPHHPVPGGIVVIRLDVSEPAPPDTKFGRTPVMVMEDPDGWLGIVGIDLDTPLGNYLVTTIDSSGDTGAKDFSIMPYSYPLAAGETIPFPSEVETSSAWVADFRAEFPFVKPIEAAKDDAFGTRYIEGESIEFARSITLHVPEKREVLAPGAGKVAQIVATEDSGTFVVLDHGMGLYTYLGPLLTGLEIDAEVDAGEPIGEFVPNAGSSPALHWKTTLNGVAVDPLLLLTGCC